MIENIAAGFVSVVLALRSQVDDFARDGVNLTMIEDSQGIAKDEVHVAFDVAVLKVLAGRDARAGLSLAGAARSVERVLRAKETDIAEDRAIAVHGKSESL